MLKKITKNIILTPEPSQSLQEAQKYTGNTPGRSPEVCRISYVFVEKYDFPFYMLSDESKEMLKSYKVWALKKFMGKE